MDMTYSHERRGSRVPKNYASRLPPPSEREDQIEEVREYLLERNLDAALAEANGWYASDRAGDRALRVVIPCSSSDAENRYWQARLVNPLGQGNALRYQSPFASRGDAVVLVWPVGGTEGTVMVEGPMDALAAAGEGYLGVGMMGAMPPRSAVEFAASVSKKPIYVIGDTDALEGATRLWKMLPESFFVNLYPYKDLAETPPKERAWRISLGRSDL